MEKNAESVFPSNIIEIKILILGSQMYPLRVHKEIPVRELKVEIFKDMGIPVPHQLLFYTGKALSDQHRLTCYNVQDGDTINLDLDISNLSPSGDSLPDQPTDQGPAICKPSQCSVQQYMKVPDLNASEGRI